MNGPSTKDDGARSKKNRKLMEALQAEADRIGEEFGVYNAARSQDQT